MRLPAASRRGALSPALPVPYTALENAGLRFRRGQMSLTVAAPGVGKSQLWQNIVQRTPVKSGYWSADTDAHDVMARVTAALTGVPVDEVDTRRRDGWAEHFDARLAEIDHVDWFWDSTITAQGVADRINKHAELHGEYPGIFVVDNLANAVQNQDSALSEQTTFIQQIQGVARESGTHIAILAHVKGEYENGTKPIPLGGVLNNLGKLPEVVLTLHRADDSGRWLGVNVAKNRGGRADPSAAHPITFEVDYSIATVHGFRGVRDGQADQPA